MFSSIQTWLSQFYLYVIGGLVAVSLGLGAGLFVTRLRLDSAKAAVVAEQNLRKADKANYERAQAQANARALQDKLEQEKKDRERADKADESYRDLLNKYNASLVRFKAAQGAASKQYPSGPTEASGSSDRSSSDTVFSPVTITMEDAQICAENTAKLQAAHDWAAGLKR